jgi:hypothetical protein
MKRRIQIFVEPILDSGDFQEIELFTDENIELTSTIQNISDISKVFTDFSQSFTIPASPNNNAIFQHFYNSDVDASVDQNIRRNAYIEIDLTPFRSGKLSLEKSNVKKGLAENYQVTFYGEIRSLKDAFGEDKLSDVKELNDYSHPYTATEVYNRITDDSIFYDVRYPLISWKNLWTISGAGTYDITKNAHPIFFNELFPAISVRRVMQAIGSKYGITFTGSWMSDQRFIKCFLLLKNVTEKKFVTSPLDVDILTLSPAGGSDYFNTTNNSLTVSYISSLTGVLGFIDTSLFHNVVFIMSGVTSASATYYIDIYQNGVFYATATGVGTATKTITVASLQNLEGLNIVFTAKVRSTENISLKRINTDTSLFDGGKIDFNGPSILPLNGA